MHNQRVFQFFNHNKKFGTWNTGITLCTLYIQVLLLKTPGKRNCKTILKRRHNSAALTHKN